MSDRPPTMLFQAANKPPGPLAEEALESGKTTAPIYFGPDGQAYEMRVEGEAEVTRGPLGQFKDLAAKLEAEGHTVPPEVHNVLQEWADKKE